MIGVLGVEGYEVPRQSPAGILSTLVTLLVQMIVCWLGIIAVVAVLVLALCLPASAATAGAKSAWVLWNAPNTAAEIRPEGIRAQVALGVSKEGRHPGEIA